MAEYAGVMVPGGDAELVGRVRSSKRREVDQVEMVPLGQVVKQGLDPGACALASARGSKTTDRGTPSLRDSSAQPAQAPSRRGSKTERSLASHFRIVRWGNAGFLEGLANIGKRNGRLFF